jgi:hypothetical protein
MKCKPILQAALMSQSAACRGTHNALRCITLRISIARPGTSSLAPARRAGCLTRPGGAERRRCTPAARALPVRLRLSWKRGSPNVKMASGSAASAPAAARPSAESGACLSYSEFAFACSAGAFRIPSGCAAVWLPDLPCFPAPYLVTAPEAPPWPAACSSHAACSVCSAQPDAPTPAARPCAGSRTLLGRAWAARVAAAASAASAADVGAGCEGLAAVEAHMAHSGRLEP